MYLFCLLAHLVRLSVGGRGVLREPEQELVLHNFGQTAAHTATRMAGRPLIEVNSPAALAPCSGSKATPSLFVFSR